MIEEVAGHMDTSNAEKQKLPSRDVAYAYAVAMHIAQLLERNLRTILYTDKYLEKGEQLRLTPEEIWRLKSKEGFLDKATCAAILKKKLRKSPQIKGKSLRDALQAFNNACTHRNNLAHWFLAEQNFEVWAPKREKRVIRELYAMSLDLYKALQISYALCGQTVQELPSEERHRIDHNMLRQLMLG